MSNENDRARAKRHAANYCMPDFDGMADRIRKANEDGFFVGYNYGRSSDGPECWALLEELVGIIAIPTSHDYAVLREARAALAEREKPEPSDDDPELDPDEIAAVMAIEQPAEAGASEDDGFVHYNCELRLAAAASRESALKRDIAELEAQQPPPTVWSDEPVGPEDREFVNYVGVVGDAVITRVIAWSKTDLSWNYKAGPDTWASCPSGWQYQEYVLPPPPPEPEVEQPAEPEPEKRPRTFEAISANRCHVLDCTVKTNGCIYTDDFTKFGNMAAFMSRYQGYEIHYHDG